MNIQNRLTAEELDRKAFDAIRQPRHQDMLVFAAKRSGRSVLSIQRDFSRLTRSIGRINMVEYLLHGLFEEGRYSEEERLAFLGNDQHWQIAHRCNPPGWQHVAEDKVLAATVLRTGGVQVPDCLAMIDRSLRLYPDLPKISSSDALRSFCLEHVKDGLFGKIVGGMVGFGVFRIEKADATHIYCANHAPMTYADFMQNVIGENAYLIQRRLRNHSKFDRYASALATVRMVNLVTDTEVKTPIAALAMAQGSNIADAFWRDGNIACGLDVSSGRIETVARRDDMIIEYLPDHPHEVGLMGLELPYWDELRDMNEKAARLLAPIRYQSTDIAITESGPVIVEINYGGGFGLPQQATGRGMLTDEVTEFFTSCGYDFDANTKKRRSLFGRG